MTAMTETEATTLLRTLLQQHGLPRALSRLSIRERDLVPLAVRSALYATASRTEQIDAQTDTTTTNPQDAIGIWCDHNPYAVVNTRQIATACNVSPHSVRKYIQNNPWRFKQINHYTYEVINTAEMRAKAER